MERQKRRPDMFPFSIPNLPSATKLPPGKFLCGLRVSITPEPSASKFSMKDMYTVIKARPNDSETLQRLFQVLGLKDGAVSEPAKLKEHKDKKRQDSTNAFLSKKEQNRTMELLAMREQDTTIAFLSKKRKTEPAFRSYNPCMSDSVEEFLNGSDSDDSILEVTAANCSMTTTTNNPTNAGSSSSSQLNQKFTIPNSQICSNKFSLVTSLSSPPEIKPWAPTPTAFDTDTTRRKSLKLYVHKVTNKVFVRGEDGKVYRAIYQDEVAELDQVEMKQQHEDDGWDFMDDAPYLQY